MFKFRNPFMLTSTHDAIVAAKDADIDIWRSNYDKQFIEADKQRGRRDAYKRELDQANRELARWKPARDAKGHFIKAGAEAQKVRA